MTETTQQSPGTTQTIPKKKKWYKRWWVIVIGVFILFMLISAIGNSGKQDNQPAENSSASSQKSDTTTQADKPATPAKPDVIVTSVALAKAYADNEVAADAKYKDKLIQISGTIYNVSNGTFDNELVVNLSGDQYGFNNSACTMKASEKDKVLALKKGQQVILIGTGNSATLGSPSLIDCVVK